MGVVFVADLADGTELGYKYFTFNGGAGIKITYRGTGSGSLEVRTDPLLSAMGALPVTPAATWMTTSDSVLIPGGRPCTVSSVSGVRKN